MADTLQYKIITSRNSGLLNLPSLPQSRTPLARGTSTSDKSHRSNESDMESVFSDFTAISVSGNDTITTHDSDSEESSSSSSSDWDARTIISTVSTVLPPRQKTHQSMDLANNPYLSEQFVIEFKADTPSNPQFDITYDLYQLFYPFTNIQSLLFSQLHPYIESDYKKIKGIQNTENESISETIVSVQMDWNDIVSVNRIKELIAKLLSSSNNNQGIKEDEFYLMFSSPSPSEIIEQLRFGALSLLCNVHMDRFGRRSYHYRHNSHDKSHKRRQSQLHFYNHSRVPSSMFGEGDIIGLSDFIEEDIKSYENDNAHDRNQSVMSSLTVAKIHYHDNDTVMVTKNKNGKVETEVQWQNFAIHSFLYRNTRTPQNSQNSVSDPMSKRIMNKQSISIIKQNAINNITKTKTRMRAIGQYGHKKIPHIFKTSKMNVRKLVKAPSYKAPKPPKKSKSDLKKNKKNSPKHGMSNNIYTLRMLSVGSYVRGMNSEPVKITKEGILEKENVRSIANIVNKYWVRYWCVLWGSQLLLYKNSQKRNSNKERNAIECIALKSIAVPISTSYDTINDYWTFRLSVVKGDMVYKFRSKRERDRNFWLAKIDNVLDYDNNVKLDRRQQTDDDDSNKNKENCVVM